ncbi:MAG: hypothetical protein ACLQU3_03965 [Limisphaerales bacterium]
MWLRDNAPFRRGGNGQNGTAHDGLCNARCAEIEQEDAPELVATTVGVEHGDRDAGDVQVGSPQPSPYYLAALPPDKPKFAAADLAVEAPFDPPEVPGG